jgi:hypothetical protein
MIAIAGVSHIAIGVQDMESALRFYRDFLGLPVTLDTMERRGPQQGDGAASERRAVYMRLGLSGTHLSSFLTSSPHLSEDRVTCTNWGITTSRSGRTATSRSWQSELRMLASRLFMVQRRRTVRAGANRRAESSSPSFSVTSTGTWCRSTPGKTIESLH